MRASYFAIVILLIVTHSLALASGAYAVILLPLNVYLVISSLMFVFVLYGYGQIIIRGRDAKFHAYAASIIALASAGAFVAYCLVNLGNLPAITTILVVSLMGFLGGVLSLKTKKATRSYFIQ